ncbi:MULTISPECIES: hypothetical protein [Citrobacter]|nr:MULTISPECIES: hypothetical protein [Citrobacter]TKU44098.1 DUF4113 domain-containing protein [Citrobacter sp. wls716]MBJ8399571.1 hypothetical protein [Citrobacter youngae]MBJ8883556.1 hypothetical protein [Citrobacter sp. FDAARGOS_156]MBJ8956407.1 hypothetical protein [Citrobacter youngae]MBJ9111265.1 hypothetical protein [Citrobacter sp. FDAARGOS_156]
MKRDMRSPCYTTICCE